MKTKPTILITNDDGVHAPGIRHLWQSLKHFGNLVVAAPSKEQSATSLSITLRDPLKIDEMEWEGTPVYSITGTPADCVKIGLSVILDEAPDLIVSGINRGTNAGRNVLYSGTVAATIEGALHDIPSIAFSCWDYHGPIFEPVAHYVPKIVDHVLHHPLRPGTLLNVNFPGKEHQIQGFKLTRQGKQYWAENPDKRSHPAEGNHYYWLGARLAEFDEIDDCDISWLKKGYITAVPIQVNELTDHDHLIAAKTHFESLAVNIPVG